MSNQTNNVRMNPIAFRAFNKLRQKASRKARRRISWSELTRVLHKHIDEEAIINEICDN